MLLYIVRHGIAIDRADPECPPDPQRALTPKGIRRTRQVARAFAALHDRPHCIVTSPYTRARETAELFAAEFTIAPDSIKQTEALLPAADPAMALDYMRQSRAASMLCAGHAPNLDCIIAALLGLDAPVTDLKKAGIAVLEWDGSHYPASLYALYPPRLLRMIASSPNAN